MTGNSWNRKYWKKMVSGLLIVGGGFLMIEHLFTFKGFDIELIGHEYLGIGMILVALLLSMKWEQLPAFINAIKDRKLKKMFDEGER